LNILLNILLNIYLHLCILSQIILQQTTAAPQGFIVNSYGGYSKKGYAPYNPKKRNQDALVMAEDPKTRSLFLCVMDGHGEDGDKVSHNIKGKLANYLFNHKDFATDIKAALADVIARCETEILRDSSIETDFSGTTFVCAVIRGNRCTMANIGDSRVSLAFRDGDTGSMTAVALTMDHKPDLPAEKARIQNKGGRVFAVEYDDGIDGPARVWLGHMDVPGLAMSRSLGDVVAHSAGVSSEPEFFEYVMSLSLISIHYCCLHSLISYDTSLTITHPPLQSIINTILTLRILQVRLQPQPTGHNNGVSQ
jgi:serine/threonine protein phosphatase PrpC